MEIEIGIITFGKIVFFSKDFPSHKGGGTCKIEEFKLKDIINFNGKAVPYAGDIMNIYFEYNYLLGEVQGNRDKSSGTLNLLKFIDSILDTANDCLGGINKLSTRIVDDNRLEIYDQTPLYGTQAPAPATSIINLFGIGNTLGGSFVKNFGITTELTSEFATQVTIGAQAQGSKDTTDALALSNWNYGLIDRIIPKKLSSSELFNDASKPVTTYESIINLRNQLALLWTAYSEGAKVLNLQRATLTDQQVDDFQVFIETKSKTKEADRFFDTATDENLQDTDVSEKKSYYFQHFPTKRYSEFVKLQKDFLALLHINSDFNSNQQGMLPINISLDIQGLSGIRIYDQLPIDTRFIPNYYPQTLYWIIKGVSHNISNNVWTTKLETIAVPKIPDLPTATSQTKSSKISEKSYESIPWDDILPISVENYSEGFDGANSGNDSDNNGDLESEFKSFMADYVAGDKLLWAPIENLDTVSVSSIPKPARSVGGSAPRNHYGIDISAPIGTKLYAAANGVFKYGNSDPNGYGNSWGYIEESDTSGTVIRRHIYGHTNSVLVNNGASVKKGDIIATVGNKGRSTGPHLHYEIWYPNKPKRQSPVAYLNKQTPTSGSKTFS
jgi:murein DD-endopeptidase MepM/ murein hydrolase activator NlpD